MNLKPLLLAVVALTLAATAHAQWKWKDAKGNVQYSDRPPPAGTPDKDILQRPAAASRSVTVVPADQPASAASAPKPAASAPGKAEQEAAARQKQEQDRENAKQKEEERKLAEQRRENCLRAQANLRELQSGVRITRTNEKGERVFMDDAQRQAEADRIRTIMTSDCR
ncbi:DUF4124 domain-containing protein [Pelomonas cellulosilytica]|uniref:DUF4124 domain-containing protein n=1 Tax=Pelomonas cellulosilytica TaxID=2906762 RepID=A0ABS8XQG0_9BURK|nr:DUF4124 domain-containing protein [Pelomonas sp. P8]MCE4553525.1 DUF4124 domain-containing protein [Pelomonas sp. P8]